MKLLNELCEINIGKTPARANGEYWSGEHQWLAISDLKSKYIINAKEGITQKAIQECNMKLIPRDTVVMSFKLSLGKSAILKKQMYSNEAIASFPIKNPAEIIPEYLYYALKTINLEKYADKAAKGVTLNKKKLNLIEIPYTDIERQKKIVRILELAEKLIVSRKYQISALDELTQSVFLEMFGDPVDNPYNFEREKLGELIDVIGGYAFKSNDFIDEGIPVIKIGTANKGYFDLNTLAFLPQDFGDKYEKYLVTSGDLLITLTGTVGKDDYANICEVTDDYSRYLLNQRVAKLKIKSNNINKHYLFYCFKQKKFKEQLTSVSRGVRQANISNDDIKKLLVPLPSLKTQEKFSEIILKIELQKKVLTRSLNNLELLYNSLLQKAFKDELFQEQKLNDFVLQRS